MLSADDAPATGTRGRGAVGRWWTAERRRTSLAASQLELVAGSSSQPGERSVLVLLLVILPTLKSAQLLLSFDAASWVAARQALMVTVLFVWFLVATRHDRPAGRVDARRAIGLVSAGRGASHIGAAGGRLALIAAFLAGFVVAPTWGRLPLVALSGAGVAALWWLSHRSADPDGRPTAESALLVTLLPPIVVYAVVGVVLLADGRPSDAHVWEVVRVVVVTAIGEELIYRGLLFALAIRSFGVSRAVLVTSASFGLWHVGDALVAADESSMSIRVATVIAIVVATTVGGLVFSWSRIRTGSLAGPVLLHTSTNLPGIALGVEVDVDEVAAALGIPGGWAR